MREGAGGGAAAGGAGALTWTSGSRARRAQASRGQLDFIRGASRSKGGKPIIALPSKAKGGTVSRIVDTLAEGSGVVTTRADVHYVVTEHGIARLFGKSLRERARELIAVADPDFRRDLESAARRRNLI